MVEPQPDGHPSPHSPCSPGRLIIDPTTTTNLRPLLTSEHCLLHTAGRGRQKQVKKASTDGELYSHANLHTATLNV